MYRAELEEYYIEIRECRNARCIIVGLQECRITRMENGELQDSITFGW